MCGDIFGYQDDWGIATGTEWVEPAMLDVFLWAAQLHSTKDFLVTCVTSKCPTGYSCSENPYYNELNLQPNSVLHVKAKQFFLHGFNIH